MANIPIINPPDKEHLGFCWHHQFTIPLLFDDCLSLLQKVCALWAKLNDVIDALNVFNDEFNAWAKSVEESLKDLYAKYEALDTRVTNIENELQSIQTELTNIKNDISNIEQRLDNVENRLTTVEGNIEDIRQSISNINESIEILESDLTALEARVKKLEDLLKNLNIIPPIDIYNATDEEFANGLWANWWNWLKSKLYFNVSDIANGWEYSPNVVWWDTTTRLPRYFQLGRVTQPITLCKLPFVAVRKNTFDHEPTIEDLQNFSPRYNNNAFTAGNGFFDFPLTSPFGFTMDEIKFQTSYIPFLPVNSKLYYSRTGGAVDSIKNINCGVRVQVPITGTLAKLSVTSDILIMGACPNSVPITDNTKWDMYIYAVAENG
jgi:archaellum component FlaC